MKISCALAALTLLVFIISTAPSLSATQPNDSVPMPIHSSPSPSLNAPREFPRVIVYGLPSQGQIGESIAGPVRIVVTNVNPMRYANPQLNINRTQIDTFNV